MGEGWCYCCGRCCVNRRADEMGGVIMPRNVLENKAVDFVGFMVEPVVVVVGHGEVDAGPSVGPSLRTGKVKWRR